MPKLDVRPIAEKMIEAVRAYVAKAEAALITRLAALEARLAALPAPQKGDPGEPGKDGRDGVDGESVHPDTVRQMLADEVQAAIAALPKPKDGKDGKDVDLEAVAMLVDIRVATEVEKRVAALPKPKNGESVHPDTIALMVREAADKLVAALPKPKDGSDGFGLEDFDVELGEDGRTLSLRFVRGSVRVERQVRLASIIDRGVYRPETKYEKGDGVTFGGSFWIAQGDEPTDKPGLSEQWRLAVKRGRDGKDTK